MSDIMTDVSEMNKRVSRIEGGQQGLNTYLPLLLKRFEGIEDRLEADLNETRQELKQTERKIEAKLESSNQKLEARLEATEQRLEADLKATDQKMDDIHKQNSEGIAKLQSDNRNMLIALILTGIGIAASIYFT